MSNDPQETREARPAQSTPTTPRLTFAEGQIVADRFRIVRFIASGGMGELYEAEDLRAARARRAQDDQARDRPGCSARSRASSARRSWRGR